MMAPNIDPVLIALGPIQIRWYGLMYVIGLSEWRFFAKNISQRGF